jgi:hypothetical protein
VLRSRTLTRQLLKAPLLLRGEISSQSSVDLPLSCVPHGFKRHVLAGLVRRELAAAAREVAMAAAR